VPCSAGAESGGVVAVFIGEVADGGESGPNAANSSSKRTVRRAGPDAGGLDSERACPAAWAIGEAPDAKGEAEDAGWLKEEERGRYPDPDRPPGVCATIMDDRCALLRRDGLRAWPVCGAPEDDDDDDANGEEEDEERGTSVGLGAGPTPIPASASPDPISSRARFTAWMSERRVSSTGRSSAVRL
jgi:hypothetical protein